MQCLTISFGWHLVIWFAILTICYKVFLPLIFIPSSLLHVFLIQIGFYLVYFTINIDFSPGCNLHTLYPLPWLSQLLLERAVPLVGFQPLAFLTWMLLQLLTQYFLLFLLTTLVLQMTWSYCWTWYSQMNSYFCYFLWWSFR